MISEKEFFEEDPTSDWKTFEEFSPCVNKLNDFEECMVFEEGE